MQSQRKGSYLWLGIVLVLIFVMFTSSIIGGVVGFSIARKWSGSVTNGGTSSIPALTIEPVNNVNGSGTTQQTLSVTEQSASVETVNNTLPAVVTVLTQVGFGGGSGSGFFISQDGYVVTNNHVVEGASDISIVYAKGGTAPASIVGVTPEFDLAVLKVDGPVPAILAWGDSSELPLGGTVIAIGSALGQYQNSVTSGVLSGYNRQLAGMGGLLQTDAAINQGNSGGPLVDSNGYIIGVNTAVILPAQGLCFAVASNLVKFVVGKLILEGKVRRGFIGVGAQAVPLPPKWLNALEISTKGGIQIQTVEPNGPAAQAGIQPGDILVQFEGKPLDSIDLLHKSLDEDKIGKRISVWLLRNGGLKSVEVVPAEM